MISQRVRLVVKLDGVSHLLSRLWDVHLIRLFDMLVISIMNAVFVFHGLTILIFTLAADFAHCALALHTFLSMKSNLSWFCNFPLKTLTEIQKVKTLPVVVKSGKITAMMSNFFLHTMLLLVWRVWSNLHFIAEKFFWCTASILNLHSRHSSKLRTSGHGFLYTWWASKKSVNHSKFLIYDELGHTLLTGFSTNWNALFYCN